MNGRNVDFHDFSSYHLDYESVKNFVLKASSGILRQKDDSKYELTSFQVVFCLYFSIGIINACPYIYSLRGNLHSPKCSFEIPTAVCCFSFLLFSVFSVLPRSITHLYVPLIPAVSPHALAGSCSLSFSFSNACHLEFCPMHDIYDDEKACTLFCVLFPSSVSSFGAGRSRYSRSRLDVGQPRREFGGHSDSSERMEGGEGHGGRIR